MANTVAPFFGGVAFSMLALGERPAAQFYIALLVMLVSTWFMIKDTVALQHTHEHTHTHSHTHIHGENTEDHNHLHKDMPTNTCIRRKQSPLTLARSAFTVLVIYIANLEKV